jgi:hypothetical protein
MIARQRGAALLVLMLLLATALAAFGIASLQRGNTRDARRMQDQTNFAQATQALHAAAFTQRCRNTTLPPANLLPCPDAAATEGIAASSCPGLTRGWLPWRTLGLPPLRDSSGTCLWYERQGTTARVIAAGAPIAGQNRNTIAGRPQCGGNLTATNYVDATDASRSLTLNTAAILGRCP